MGKMDDGSPCVSFFPSVLFRVRRELGLIRSFGCMCDVSITVVYYVQKYRRVVRGKTFSLPHGIPFVNHSIDENRWEFMRMRVRVCLSVSGSVYCTEWNGKESTVRRDVYLYIFHGQIPSLSPSSRNVHTSSAYCIWMDFKSFREGFNACCTEQHPIPSISLYSIRYYENVHISSLYIALCHCYVSSKYCIVF